jgi:RHS repeat-associated protein
MTNSNFSEYIFFGSARIARRDASGNVFYYVGDHLGSSRVIVQAGQTTPCYDADFYPFGGEIAYANTCQQNYKFTGKERDPETNLDNFGARFYSSGSQISFAPFGCFMSADWSAKVEPVPYAKLDNPQSLNLYAYVLNNPLIHIDADGHIIDDSSLQKNKQYQKWKKEYLSHAKGREQWNALNDNKTLTVHMSWDSKATKSLTSGYQWNKSGELTSVNVSLAAKTGNINYHMSAAAGYIHGATITDPAQRQAYLMAHEFGHVEYAQTPGGHASLVQSEKDYSFTSPMFKRMGIQAALQLPAVQQANQRLLDASQEREQGADKRAWDIVGPQQ